MERLGAEGRRLPIATLDLDGVICAPPLGKNLGIHRTFLDPYGEPRPARVPPRWLSWPLDHLRFDIRRPLPGVHEALRELRALRTIVVLTGRRSSPSSWLRRYGLDELVDGVVSNDTDLRSPHFKLRRTAELGAREHLDDDGRTAQLLAEAGTDGVRSYLRDWPRNRDLPFHEGVTRVEDLAAFVRALREAAP